MPTYNGEVDLSINSNEESTDDQILESNILIKSFPSSAINSYIINSPSGADIKFIYNYFVKNEREFIQSNPNEIIIEENYEDNFSTDFLIKTQTLPRVVKITYKRPAGYVDNELTDVEKNLISNFDPKNITTNSSDLNSSVILGFELTDIDSEESVLEKLKQSSLLIQNQETTDQSYQDMAKSLSELLNDPGGITGNAKKVLMSKLSATRSKGFAVSPDENREVSSNNPISNENFTVKINKLHIKNSLRYATTINAGLYENELLSLKNMSDDIREQALTSIAESGGVNAISEEDYSIFAIPVSVTPISENTPIEQAITKKLAGYLIEKIEQTVDENIIKHPATFIRNPNQLQHLDSEVRYGGKYIYKIRSVVLFEAPSYMLNENPALDQLVMAKYLVASEGIQTSVFCVETVPPKPPSGIRCRFDFNVKKPVISWQFPINKQRDIKRFQVFKRLSIDDPFTLIAEFDFDNSTIKTGVKEIAMSKNLHVLNPKIPKLSHIDTTYNTSQKPIYSVASVDAHGLTSNLSTQLQVEYLKYENRLKKTLISREGAPKQYPNVFIEQDTFLDNIKSSGDNRLIVYFNPEYYQVFKNSVEEYKQGVFMEKEVDLNHIAVDPTKDTYKIQIINLDLQKDQVINIRIEDSSSPARSSNGSSFNALRHNNFLN